MRIPFIQLRKFGKIGRAVVKLIGVAVVPVGRIRAAQAFRRCHANRERGRKDGDGQERGPGNGLFKQGELRILRVKGNPGREERDNRHHVGQWNTARQTPESRDADDAPEEDIPLRAVPEEQRRSPGQCDDKRPDKGHAAEEFTSRAIFVAIVLDKEAEEVLVDEEVSEESWRLAFHQNEPGGGDAQEDERPGKPAEGEDFAPLVVDAGVDHQRTHKKCNGDWTLDEHAERQREKDAERPVPLFRPDEQGVGQIGAGDAGHEKGVRHAEARQRVDGDGGRTDADREQGASPVGQGLHRVPEEPQQGKGCQEAREPHGDFPTTEDFTGGTCRLEEKRGLPVEALVDVVVGEPRNEKVARARHIGGNGGVAGLRGVEDRRHRGDEEPCDGEHEKDCQNRVFAHTRQSTKRTWWEPCANIAIWQGSLD